VKLSPAAKSFVPEFTLSVQNASVNHEQHSALPHYMTSCYPFVHYDHAQSLQWVVPTTLFYVVLHNIY